MTSVDDVPDDLCVAIAHAQKIHNWYKNLQPEEMPPRYYWPFDDLLVEWFEDVKRKRDERIGNPSADTDRKEWERNEMFSQGLRD